VYHTTVSFSTARSKPVVAQFNGGKLTSDAGALLLKLADKKLRLSKNVVIASKLFFKDAGSQESFRLFDEYCYQAGSWDYARSIIVKAERLPDGSNLEGKENTRYIVTNLLSTLRWSKESMLMLPTKEFPARLPSKPPLSACLPGIVRLQRRKIV